MTPERPTARPEIEDAAHALARPARLHSPGSQARRETKWWVGPIAVAALFVLALLYFRATYDRTLEWVDEGQLVYASWRVADGSIPYRDFVQLYGPSVFFLNAALFDLFGVDVHVVRVSLLLLRALGAVIVFLCARRVAAWPFALAAYVLFVVVWGAPWWVFNAPYANHYGVSLSLMGVLVFLSVPRFRLGCVLAGLCFGAAATFKQTSGIFSFLAFVLFLLFQPAQSAVRRDPGWPGETLLRIVVMTVLAGSLAVAIFYLRPNNTLWNAALLIAPLAVSIGWMALRELRGQTSAAGHVDGLVGAMYCLAGMLVLPAGYAAWYLSLGSLDELFFNTLYGLPQTVKWLVPYEVPKLRALLALAALLAAATAIRLWRTPAAGDGSTRRAAWIALTVSVLAASGIVAELVFLGLLPRYIGGTGWIGDAFSLVYAIPLLSVSLALILLFRGGPALATSRPALALLSFYGAATLLLLYPSADFLHAMMLLPSFLPLLAFCLESFHRVANDGATRSAGATASAIFLVVVLLVLVFPFVRALPTTIVREPPHDSGFSRATGIWDAEPKFRETGDLVRHLNARATAQPVYSLAGDQMVYFLSARLSPLEKYEYVLYLVQGGLIGPQDARSLAPEQMLIDRLAAAESIVIDYEGSLLSRRLREMYPGVVRHLETHYRLTGTFGKYRVWEPSATSGDSRPSS